MDMSSERLTKRRLQEVSGRVVVLSRDAVSGINFQRHLAAYETKLRIAQTSRQGTKICAIQRVDFVHNCIANARDSDHSEGECTLTIIYIGDPSVGNLTT